MAEGGNIIQRIIRLVLDRKSADETEAGAKGVAANVEQAWKDTAKRIAGYLGVAFLTAKIVAFGKESVDQATASEDAWSDLAGSIDATGESFDAMNERLRASADAFQDATIHDDDAYAVGLSRLITLSGDVGASTNNMGLVANVAAKFYKGELAPATDLVAKAMNGNTAALGKMGIKAESAQQALEILAERSMGAAEKRASTFSGQLAQLGNAWDDVKKDIGNAIIQSDGASSAFDVLRAVVAKLGDWVIKNKQAISDWVTKGINLAIDAADVLIRAVDGMARILAGGFQTGIGLAAKGLAILTRGYVTATNAASVFLEFIGKKDASDALDLHAASMLNEANAIDAWADAAIKAGSDKVAKGIDILSTPLFSSKDFAGGKQKVAPGPLAVNAPQIGKNAELTDAEKAWKKFDDTISQAKSSIAGTGAELKLLEAQADAIATLMKDLATAGVKPASDEFQFLAGSLRQVNAQIEEAKKAAALTEDFRAFAAETEAAERTASAFGTKLQDLQGEAGRLQTVIKNLIADGIDPHDEALQALIDRLHEVQEAIDGETAAMQFQQQVAGDLAQALFASFGGGLGPFARMKAKQNYLEATENGIRAVLAALTGFGALHAGKYAAAAAQHAALGAAWSALASTVGGGGGGGGASMPSGGGSSPGAGVGSARTGSAAASRKAEQPIPVTEIHFVGPGFDAVNPQVQKVVLGAQQEAIERAGNVRVRVVRTPS
jgi:hypothetical protein